MMSSTEPEREKKNLTDCVSFCTHLIDIRVCIRVRGLHIVFSMVTLSAPSSGVGVSHLNTGCQVTLPKDLGPASTSVALQALNTTRFERFSLHDYFGLKYPYKK